MGSQTSSLYCMEENHRAVRSGVVGSEGAEVPASALHLLASLGPLLREPGPVQSRNIQALTSASANHDLKSLQETLGELREEQGIRREGIRSLAARAAESGDRTRN